MNRTQRILIDAPEEHYGKTVADLLRLVWPQVDLQLINGLDKGENQGTLETLQPEEVYLRYRIWEAKASLERRETSLEQGENGEVLWTVEAQLRTHKQPVHCRVETKRVDPTGQLPEEDWQRRLIRKVTRRVLVAGFGEQKVGPWGILTGIRPTKVVHRLWDQAWPLSRIEQELVQEYLLTPAKAQLLTATAQRQRPFLLPPIQAQKTVSVYIGIPFCPSRCLYCSFPGYPLKQSGGLIPAFLQALHREIQGVGRELKDLGIQVQSVYLGGGTPTVLNPVELSQLLELCRTELGFNPAASLDLAKRGEFTVEAGRPDTLDPERLRVLKELGVNRLSINPQTMQDQTLRLIGRGHSAAQVFSAFDQARAAGFDWLNMDFILGLPGETSVELADTLQQIAPLKPANISLHTLAIKRASRLHQEGNSWSFADQAELEAMQQFSVDLVTSWGMQPYYLYRQKRILGHLENVGYTRPGWISPYNIQVMEERQTIIGLGGGAGSKWVNPKDWTLVNTYNPKDPQVYIARIQEITRQKMDRIQYMG